MDEANPNQYLVASLSKGLHVLRVVADAPAPLRLPEVAAAAGFPPATTYRLLRTLEHHGFLRLVDGQRYAPGMAILTLGFDTLASLDIVQVATPVLTRAAQITGESSNLSVIANHSVLVLFRTAVATFARPAAAVGSMLPAAATSAGKALLAALDDDALEAELASIDLSAAHGPRAIRDVDTLRDELQLSRERGWAMQDEETVRGLRSIAACVYDSAGTAVAAVNLSFSTDTATMDEIVERYVPVLMNATEEISTLLGARRLSAQHRQRLTG